MSGRAGQAHACGGSDGDSGDEVASSDAGVLFIDGEYIEPPYRITVDAGRISINGSVAYEFAQTEPQEDVQPPDDPQDAGELAQVAATMLEAIGWPQRFPSEDEVAAIGREIEALPAADSAVVEDDTLVIRDRDGGEERLMWWIQPASDEPQHEQLAASMADAWSQRLGEDGVLIVAGGATLGVPSAQRDDFMRGLVEALDSDSDRESLLGELIGDAGGRAPDPDPRRDRSRCVSPRALPLRTPRHCPPRITTAGRRSRRARTSWRRSATNGGRAAPSTGCARPRTCTATSCTSSGARPPRSGR